MSKEAIPDMDTVVEQVDDQMDKWMIWISSKSFNKAVKFGILIDGRYVYFDREITNLLMDLVASGEEVFYVINDQMYKAFIKDRQIFQINESTGVKREIIHNPLEKSINEWYSRYEPYEPRGVVLQVRFPSDFPSRPPFVFVEQPRLEAETSHVTRGGSICTEYLTVGDSSNTWRSDSTLKDFMEHIIHYCLLDVSDLDKAMRVDVHTKHKYSEVEARASYVNQSQIHGWKVR